MPSSRSEASKSRYSRGLLAVLALALLAAIVALLVITSQGADDEAVGATPHPDYPAGTACDAADCHDDYSHQIPYVGPCQRCHVLSSWRIVSYSHENQAFSEGAHAVVGCSYCHEEGQPPPAPACATCHLDRSPHEDGRLACERCHVSISWRLVTFPADHLSLEGGHAGLACDDCHDAETFSVAGPGCQDCHGPRHGYERGCEACHSPERFWRVDRKRIAHETFRLVGGHAGLECERCHGSDLRFVGTSKRCVDCHGENHCGVTDCESCHAPARFWDVNRECVDHSFFPLEGGHSGVGCESCHPQLCFGGTSSRCVSCHGTKHGGVTNCELCHSPSAGWKVLHFDHSFYPLHGVHEENDCDTCHPGNNFEGQSPVCTACHGRPHGSCLSTCWRCHTTKSWSPADFDHSSVFPLTGAHSQLDCGKCHPSGVRFCEVPGDQCVDCHGARHGSCLPKCEDCHNTSAWIPPQSFSHPPSFPLTGEHATAPCTACHPNDVFCTPLDTACSSCHGEPHGDCLPTCQNCHTPAGWSPADFDHASVFPLVGQHATLECSACHGDPSDPDNIEFCVVPGNECVDCHGEPHGDCLPTCQNCHTPAGWSPADFDHASVFPLVGQHATLECSACHGDPSDPDNIEFCVVPGDECVDCHGPNHGGVTDCEPCHTPVGWVPIKPDFGHPIPLGGFHAITPADPTCDVCHRNNNFVSPARPCEICHLDDIPHVGPTDCLRCHWPTYWADLHFQHPTMPPQHDPFMDECARCHPGGDFTAVQCTPCHAGVPSP